MLGPKTENFACGAVDLRECGFQQLITGLLKKRDQPLIELIVAVMIIVIFTFLLRTGLTTLTNAVSGQSQNCSENLEISPRIATLENFSGKQAIIPGHSMQKKVGTSKEILFHVSQNPNFLDDLS